jgi:hypothetical protein
MQPDGIHPNAEGVALIVEAIGPSVLELRRAPTGLSMAAIAAFGFLNIRYLLWNLRAYRAFRATEAYAKLRTSNGESALLAMPLALAMSVNVGFILGLVFVPGLWGVVEYLFPFAMVAFGLIGWLALTQIGRFLGRILSQGGPSTSPPTTASPSSSPPSRSRWWPSASPPPPR